MIEVGRVIVKIAGRDAGRIGAIIDVYENNYVLIEGEVRRRKVNINHLELLNKKITVEAQADKKTVISQLKSLGYEIEEKESKEKKEKKEKPIKKRVIKEKEKTEKKNKIKKNSKKK